MVVLKSNTQEFEFRRAILVWFDLPIETYRRLLAGEFEEWRLCVDDLVARPSSFSLAELKRLPSHNAATRLPGAETQGSERAQPAVAGIAQAVDGRWKRRWGGDRENPT